MQLDGVFHTVGNRLRAAREHPLALANGGDQSFLGQLEHVHQPGFGDVHTATRRGRELDAEPEGSKAEAKKDWKISWLTSKLENVEISHAER